MGADTVPTQDHTLDLQVLEAQDTERQEQPLLPMPVSYAHGHISRSQSCAVRTAIPALAL